jgi:hypothetical protein
MYSTGNGTGADDFPTAPYGAPGAPAGGPGKNGSRGPWSRGKRAAAAIGACVVIGGGAFAVVEAATGSPGVLAADTQTAATSGFQTGTSASLAGQAATLSSALSAGPAGRLARLRRLGGMYGQYTFENKKGSHTLAFERGTITSVGGGDLVVRAANGTSWTWQLISTSVVREDGTKEPESTLADGQAVFVGGPVTNGARDARLIVIRKASPSASGAA